MEKQSTLTCEVVSDLMILYATGKASAETRRSVETHLQACPGCATAFGHDLKSKQRAQLPKTPSPKELDDLLERAKYFILPIWSFMLFLLTRLVTFLDRILRRVGLSTTHLKIRLYRARRKVAGQLTHNETQQEQAVSV